MNNLTFNDEFEKFERERDRRPLTEKADPLALSWVAYHVWKRSPRSRWAPWADLEVRDHNRDLAEETRKYYRNKLAINALRANHEPTQFQRDLYDICNGGIMRECHRGMLYRLPYFYVEDTRRAALQELFLDQPQLSDLVMVENVRALRYWGEIFVSRRSREVVEYWFQDRDTGFPVVWSVDYTNPLRSMVDYYLRNNQDCRIGARYFHVEGRDGFRYWKIAEPEIHLG